MSYRDKTNINAAVEELRRMLPISSAIRDNMDRTTVVRMTRSYMAMKNTPNLMFPVNDQDNVATSPLILQALDTFCFILDCCGRFIYVTESVSTNFGFSQCQLIGCPIYNFIHPDDKSLVYETMHKPNPNTNAPEEAHVLSIRFQCKQARRHCGFTRGGYKTATIDAFVRRSEEGVTVLATGATLDRNGYPETPLSMDQFVIHCTLDLRILLIAGTFEETLGVPAAPFCGKSLYQMIHPDDTIIIAHSHLYLTAHPEFQTQIPAVRFLIKGNYAWISIYAIKMQVPGVTRTVTSDLKLLCTNWGIAPPLPPPRHTHPFPSLSPSGAVQLPTTKQE